MVGTGPRYLGSYPLLEGMGAVVTSTKTETEIVFTFEEEKYSLKLIKHRKKEGD